MDKGANDDDTGVGYVFGAVWFASGVCGVVHEIGGGADTYSDGCDCAGDGGTCSSGKVVGVAGGCGDSAGSGAGKHGTIRACEWAGTWGVVSFWTLYGADTCALGG